MTKENADKRARFTKHLIKGNGNSSMGTIGTELGTEKVGSGILLANVAPPIGLEPMTDWLTASRSTWLSYGGMC
jgi:hypothetical protein